MMMILPEDLVRLIEEAAERGARRALAALEQDQPQADEVGIDWLASRIGGRTAAATRTWLSRNTGCPRQHVGRRLVLSRAAVEAYLRSMGE